MSSSILGSADCFKGRFRHEALTSPLPLKPPMRNAGPNFSNSRRRKQSHIASQSKPQVLKQRNHESRSQSQSMVAKLPARNLVMGQVKILKRGETLSLGPQSDGGNNQRVLTENRKPRRAKTKVEEVDLVLGSTNRLGPDPEMVQKQIRVKEFNKIVDGIYAGSALVASPPASSLPVPGFLGKSRQ